MSPASISALVEESLLGPREVYGHEAAEGAAHVSSIRTRFVERRIMPELRPVFVEAHITHLVGLPEGEHVVYFVTQDDPQSVFFDPHTESFGCAWGPEAGSGRFVDLGFRSFDVLAMASA
ncbi:MAG: hypothetical protein V4593_16220 [Pseudomonadota bacterium]